MIESNQDHNSGNRKQIILTVDATTEKPTELSYIESMLLQFEILEELEKAIILRNADSDHTQRMKKKNKDDENEGEIKTWWRVTEIQEKNIIVRIKKKNIQHIRKLMDSDPGGNKATEDIALETANWVLARVKEALLKRGYLDKGELDKVVHYRGENEEENGGEFGSGEDWKTD